jgi:hypothetical protein
MYKCFLCNKYYKSDKGLRKHYVKCGLKHKINVLNCEQELFELLGSVVKMNENLQKRVKNLETLTYKEKKKINVLEWLNENRSICITYERFLHNVEINNELLEVIFNEGIIEGIMNILNNSLKNEEEKPLMCFEEKSYVLYYKDIDGWKKLSDDEFKKGVCYLQREMLKYFRQQNPVDNLFTDKEYNTYNKRLMNICVSNFSSKIKNIRNEIYRHNKVSINKIVSYDFDF